MFSLLKSSVDGLFTDFIIQTPSLVLECGVELPQLNIAFQTWGNPKAKKNKTIWVCHALTGNQYVQDWWAGLFGIQKVFDPNEDFIVCVNTIGSVNGTTSAHSEETPANLRAFRFPVITNRDAAQVFERVRQFLEIEKIHVLIGASLGGQQAQEWLLEIPERIENSILIATNAKHSPYGIAFNETQRLALQADPSFFTDELEGGKNGLIAARAIGMLSYRTYMGYNLTQSEPNTTNFDGFRAASYQVYQGQKLSKRFNAHAYFTLSKSMDSHNVFRNRQNSCFSVVRNPVLVIGIDSDVLFPIQEQQELAAYFPRGQLSIIQSDFGHDGFLVANDSLSTQIKNFLTR